MKIRRPRMLFWLLAASVVVAGLTGASSLFSQLPLDHLLSREPPAPPARLQGVECLGRVDVEGGLLALAPVRPGRVAAVSVREGETVSADAVLLRLDEEPARLQVETARAALRAAQAQVALAEEAARAYPFRVAGQEAVAAAARSRGSAGREGLRRNERLLDQGLIGKEERASSRDEVKALEAMASAEAERLAGLRVEDPRLRVEQAGAELARAQALLAEAQYALAQCLVSAPEAGSVLRVCCGAGEVVSPQAAVIMFAPARPRLVRAEVEQELIHLVVVGQPAVVRDEMDPQWTWEGQVTRIGDWYADSPTIPRRMARFTDIPTVECLIALNPGHPPLRIGQRMTVLLGRAATTSEAGSR